MKVAAANWEIRNIGSEREFYDHFQEFVAESKSVNAEWLVLPEFHAFELLNLAPTLREQEISRWLAERWRTLSDETVRLANTYRVNLIGGSSICEKEYGFANVIPVALADGRTFEIPKFHMTQYEANALKLMGGNAAQEISDTSWGAVICYDVEFPNAVRWHVENGALVVGVPTFTETQFGVNRVRWCAQARAVEMQCYVVQSSLVGSLGREPVPNALGSSAILTPSLEGFPENGILAETPSNQEAIAVADLDMEKIVNCRKSGDVRNWDDRDAAKSLFQLDG